MNDRTAHQPSLGVPDTRTIALADGVLRGERRLGLGRLLPFLGPAFIASVA